MGEKPAIVLAKVKQSTELKLLYVLQFKKGVKRQEPTFVAVLVVYEEEGGEPIPPEIKVVLKRHGCNTISTPQNLAPRRKIDHQIELVPGAMAPPELMELRK